MLEHMAGTETACSALDFLPLHAGSRSTQQLPVTLLQETQTVIRLLRGLDSMYIPAAAPTEAQRIQNHARLLFGTLADRLC